jgi:Zn-dependent protease with chaperone function
MNESRATRFQRGRRRSQRLGIVCGAIVLLILALTPAGDALAAKVTVSVGPPALSLTISLLLYTSVVLLLWEALAFAAGWGMARHDRRGTPGTLRDLYLAQSAAFLVALPAAWGLGAAVLLSWWAAGGWWWLAAAVLVGLTLGGVLHLLPGALARAAGAQPVDRPALVEALGVLARNIRVPIASIDALPPSSSVTASAMVTGAGDQRRVFIAADLMRDWSDDEISVVVAHELAHHVHHDLWMTLAMDVGVLAAGFWLVERVRGGAAAAGLQMLPVVAVLAGSVWLLATPVRHALSRWQERRADRFALALTGRADAFQAAIRRLAAEHLAEDRPSRATRWFHHRHPTAAERLEAARAFRSAN